MKTAVLLDVNYAHSNQIRSKIDWKALDLSLYVEYNEWTWLEKATHMCPDIMIIGKV